ncbi:MAG TPA: SURF1 family protein [Acetobacteraceae bacterium]|jgi:surfeit locus 1 family protein
MSGRFRRLLWPGTIAAAMLAVLLGLGTWQVRRLHWKREILAQITRAESAPAIPLPADPQPYTKVQVSGELREELAAFYGAQVRDTKTGTQLGTQLIVPLRREQDGTILVDLGWVPDKRAQPLALAEGEVTVEGYVRPSDQPGLFSVADNAAGRRFFTLNAPAIGAALGLRDVAPFVLVAMGRPPPQGYPDPAQHLPRPPNNHLSYAITWYGLAVGLVLVFGMWTRQVLTA